MIKEILSYYNVKYYIQGIMGIFAVNSLICTFMQKAYDFVLFKRIIRWVDVRRRLQNRGMFVRLSFQAWVKMVKEAILK